jgi:hypothetical protein
MQQQGGQTKFNLTTLKHDNQVNLEVATLASTAAAPLPADGSRGHTVNTTA